MTDVTDASISTHMTSNTCIRHNARCNTRYTAAESGEEELSDLTEIDEVLAKERKAKITEMQRMPLKLSCSVRPKSRFVPFLHYYLPWL